MGDGGMNMIVAYSKMAYNNRQTGVKNRMHAIICYRCVIQKKWEDPKWQRRQFPSGRSYLMSFAKTIASI
jgi:hypothetical protein